MRKKFVRIIEITIVSIMLIGISTACSQSLLDNENSQPPDETLTTVYQDRIEDLEYLCAELEKRHVDLYHNISKEAFLAEKEEIESKVSSLSDVDFFYEMKRLIALIGEKHTNIAFVPSAHDYMRPLPISLLIIDGDWYVDYIDKIHEKYLGWQIIAINDITIQEVFDRAIQIINHENQTALEERFAAEIGFIDALKYLNVTDDLMAARFTLKNKSTGLNEVVEINSYQGADIFNVEIVSWQTKSAHTSQAEDMYRSVELNQDIYFIQYNTCAEDEAYPITTFTEKIQADLASKNYSKVVVDLRYNGGGNSAVLQPVIDMLQKQQEELYFDVYTLIGRATHSSAVLNA